ncbi:MAG: NADH-quinone oxidoreductase subunit M [Thermoanaerobaculales bacterium]|jgi:NADH-quinone oxidoreductase subunit M|nr:NADH-quinone oxidoreductase subunit M [Thermoanaerobaculales bacterium]
MDTQFGWLLNLVCFLPLVGALLMLVFVGRRDVVAIRRTTVAVAAADLALAIPLWFLYRPDGVEFQFVTRFDWIASLGVQVFLGADGFAVLLILLTALVGLIAAISSFAIVAHRHKEFCAFLLMLQTGAIGVFSSLDLILFFTFFEILLVPAYFLIGIWGGSRRLFAAGKFLLVHLAGSAFFLLGILGLYFFNADGLAAVGLAGLGNEPAFSLPQLYSVAAVIPTRLQLWVFIAFFLGLAVRIPLVPLHTWMPDALVEAPMAATVMLAAVGVNIGVFGVVRVAMPLLPHATAAAVGWVGALALIGIVYGALVAMAQKDMKRLVITMIVSHMGLAVLGLLTFQEPGLSGAMLQLLNHGVSAGALLLLIGMVEQRRETRLIGEFGGLARIMPLLATFFLIAVLSAIGMPAFSGFVSRFLILIGVFGYSKLWALTALGGLVIGAACMIWMYQRVFFGEVTSERNEVLEDLDRRERWLVLPLLVVILWIGLAPQPFLDRLQPTVDRVVERMNVAVGQTPEADIRELTVTTPDGDDPSPGGS